MLGYNHRINSEETVIAKPEYDYAIYGTDTDGSQRKVATVRAKSPGHAIAIARRQGPVKQPVAERV